MMDDRAKFHLAPNHISQVLGDALATLGLTDAGSYESVLLFSKDSATQTSQFDKDALRHSLS